MNTLDKQYTNLLQDILDNGVTKQDRTGTGTISVFGRQIRHKMSEGFPLLTTKKMPFKTIVTELLWFLKGDTNIKYLVDNNCHIWDGDCFSNYVKEQQKAYKIEYDKLSSNGLFEIDLDWQTLTQEEFINKIKTDDEFAKKWGELGPIYGKQWRSWSRNTTRDEKIVDPGVYTKQIDQIANLINDLKTNPDSRRLMVNAWNVGELDQMVLPPCHFSFQVYTRELSLEERTAIFHNSVHSKHDNLIKFKDISELDEVIPTRAISLMWNQRSVDTFLGLPFNIASYGLLLEIIAKAVNMVPDELIGNLGDVHLYSNHIEQAKEQIGRKYTSEERHEMLKTAMGDFYKTAVDEQVPFGGGMSEYYDAHKIPYRTREPYQLPSLNINTEFWPRETEDGPLDAIAIVNGFSDTNFCRCLLEEDIQLGNYKSHPSIKAPLSN
jgi:thymidylate synthase